VSSVNGVDPTSRPRRTRDEELLTAQEITRRHLAGESVRVIARAVGLPRMSVQRVIQNYRRAQVGADDPDLDAELGALLSKFEGGLKYDEVQSAEDVMSLGALQYFRLRTLALDDPRREHWAAALATGWQHPSTTQVGAR
jgi:hypothetical protein